MIHVQHRELVVPGQLLAEGEYAISGGAFREGNLIYSSVVGLADVREREVGVIPLQGKYVPKRGDVVIGVVVDSHPSGWILDINSSYEGNMFVSDLLGRKVDLARVSLSRYVGVGDLVVAKVKEVDERKRVLLEGGRGMGKVTGGKLIEISPAKIPRVIGKKGSMIEILQKVGGCRLTVGQNGRILIWGEDARMVDTVVEAIFKIEREAHTTGLTDRVRQMLEEAREGGK